MKSLTGQYECMQRSGLGLDYFTAKLHRLTLYANGRFALIAQEKSRIMHAAKSLAAGEQASMEAPEARREGRYSEQGDVVLLHFDDGEEERGQVQADGVQIGRDYYEKVAETTFMPPPQRMKSNMEDIAKGLKIAGAIGGTMLKAARTIQDNLQTQSPAQNQPGTSGGSPGAPSSSQGWQAPSPAPAASYTPSQGNETLFCDQCGAPVRPGKQFCNKCGVRLP
ncbi:MAG: zinc ribbon domain-containing protein [Ktedonobacteraceae bacterium]